MWGKHVEAELHEAQHKAKNDTQAKQKMGMVIQRLLTEREEDEGRRSESSDDTPRPVKAGRFADPAARMKR